MSTFTPITTTIVKASIPSSDRRSAVQSHESSQTRYSTTQWHTSERDSNKTHSDGSNLPIGAALAGATPSLQQRAHTWSSQFSGKHRPRSTLNDLYHATANMVASSSSSKRHSALGRVEGSLHEQLPRNVSKEHWWENVLPPGQLAERLRQAQTSDHNVDVKRTSPRKQAERSNALYEERAAVERARTSSNVSAKGRPLSVDPTSYLSPHSTIPSRSRAGTWASQHSHPSSTRSSISVGESSSASSSNDECSVTGRQSPSSLTDEWAVFGFTGERSSGATSPTHSITRSQTNRRRRVVGAEDSVGLGVNFRGTKSNVIDLDERFRQWNDGLPFHPTAQHAQPNHLSSSVNVNVRPFPSASSSSSISRQSGYGGVFADTPDGSSEEDRASQRSIRRATRTSSTHTADTVRDVHGVRRVTSSRTSAPPSRRSSLVGGHHCSTTAQRRVSFNQDVQVMQGDELTGTQTIGRAHGRSMSSMSDRVNGSMPDATRLRQRFSSHAARTPDADVVAHAHSHVRGKRQPCLSAPTSPKLTTTPLHRERGPSRLGRETMTSSSSGLIAPDSNDEAASAAELALLSSLNMAQSQLSSARNLAMALTRQLSAPLRPVLHLTLFASISSMAFMALAGFLVAGYLCTVWDDVNSRGKSLHRNVSSARHTIEKRVQWTRGLLGMGNAEDEDVGTRSEPSSSTSSSTTSDARSSAAPASPRQARSTSRSSNFAKVFVLPVQLALAFPTSMLMFFTPQGVRSAFRAESTDGSTTKAKTTSSSRVHASSHRTSRPASEAADGGKAHAGFHSLPPRPPLSSLLPSIAFTIVIACGAGLASFFASRGTTAPSTPTSSARATPNSSAPPSPSTYHNHHHHHHHTRTSSSTSGRFDLHNSVTVPSSPAHVRRRSAHSSASSSFTNGGSGGEPINVRHVNLDGRRTPSFIRHDVSSAAA